MKTIESLQRWHKAKGFDPDPIDGLDGPKTFAAWSVILTKAVTENSMVRMGRVLSVWLLAVMVGWVAVADAANK
jgi:hypothetical protein